VQGCLLRGPASLRQSGFAIQLRRDKELRRGLPGFAGASLRWDVRFATGGVFSGFLGFLARNKRFLAAFGRRFFCKQTPNIKLGAKRGGLLPEVGGEGRTVLRSGMAAE